MRFKSNFLRLLICGLIKLAWLSLFSTHTLATQDEPIHEFVQTYCVDCHSGSDAERGFTIDELDFSANAFSKPELAVTQFELVLRRLEARQMPPAGASRPSKKEYDSVAQILAKRLDSRPTTLTPLPTLRRLTRKEYENSIRDLLGIQVDASLLLPKDPSSHGFDNITVTELSPLLLDRYVKAAEHVARQVVASNHQPIGRTVRLPADRSQEHHVPGLPFGSRGGTRFTHRFPRSGIYQFEMKLTRDRDEKVEGLNRKHQLDLLINRDLIKRFDLIPPQAGNWENRDFSKSDSHLNIRAEVESGEHEICVTFPMTSSSLVEDKRKPFDTNFNRHRHPRKTPALYQVSIVGPLNPAPENDNLSEQSNSIAGVKIPATTNLRRKFARRYLSDIANRAYRRNLESGDVEHLMKMFDQAITESDRDALQSFREAIELSLASILVHPKFLFRVESRKTESEPNANEHDFRLASRLSFFIWSSIPDDELLRFAQKGKLSDPATLSEQVDRMLRDDRANALVSNFADQWLYLRNLESITPDLRRFPDFDDNLRQSFRLETQLLFRDMLENDRSIMSLIRPEHAFLNRRLAIHYDIPSITGDHFRKVKLADPIPRGGLLRHGSILMVTSYATRTSPTLRGNWVLENILGLPAPPPPPNVPNLKERSQLNATTIRERLELHRKDPACASCHDLMDPIGFTLENFDAVGRWRILDEEDSVDSLGKYLDGSTVSNVSALEQKILNTPRLFARTLTEKLMTYALGRVVDEFDQPAIRKIVNQSESTQFRFSEIVKGIVLSPAFQSDAGE